MLPECLCPINLRRVVAMHLQSTLGLVNAVILLKVAQVTAALQADEGLFEDLDASAAVGSRISLWADFFYTAGKYQNGAFLRKLTCDLFSA